MKLQRFLEWTIITVVILGFIVWLGYSRPGQAQNYWEEDQGGLWMDPNAPVQPYERRPHPVYREAPSRLYYDDGPYNYGPVEQRPDIIIYRGQGRFTTH